MDFSSVETEYRQLKAQFDADQLTEADFKARLQELMFEDEQDRWWMIGYETGQWYVHDGEKWVPAEPPHPAAAPPVDVRSPGLPESGQKTKEVSAEAPTASAAGHAAPMPMGIPASEPIRPRNASRWLLAGLVGVVVLAVAIGIGLRGGGSNNAVPTVAIASPTLAAADTTEPRMLASELTEAPTVAVASSTPAAAGTVEPRILASEPTETMTTGADQCAYGGEIKSIEAVDDMTVKFSLCYPDPAFPAKAADTALQIWPSEVLTKLSGTTALLEEPVGTGPYMLKEWRRGDQLILEANPNYWGEKAKTENLVFRWSPEAAQRLLELQSGNVNGIDNPAPDDFAVIEGDSTLTLYPRAGTNIFYVGMNNTYPPFDNEKVRQAFAMAIDRKRIVDNFYPAGSTLATQFMPPSIFGYSEGQDWYEYNPEMAKQILTKEGVYDANGVFKTSIAYRDVVRGYLPEPGVVAQDIQTQLKEIGVEAEIKVMESGSYLDAADAGQLDGFHLLGWGADYPDATNFLDYHFGGGASKQFGEKFPDLVDVLQRAAALADPAERQPIYDEANELVKQHVPMIPVAHGGSATAWKAVCEGAHSSPLHREKLGVVDCGGDTLVFMQNAEPISLYCADETDGETFRACGQINEALLSYAVGTTEVEPALAEKYNANEELTEWTFTLRPDVTFSDGSALDSEDVVTSWTAQWDAASPLHKGRTGDFTYFQAYFGKFKNAPGEPAQ